MEIRDTRQQFFIRLENSVLHHRLLKERIISPEDYDAKISLDKDTLIRILLKIAEPKEILFSDAVEVNGNPIKLVHFLTQFDRPNMDFPIVTR